MRDNRLSDDDLFPTYFKWQIQDTLFYLLTPNLALILQHCSMSVTLKQAEIRLQDESKFP